MLLFTVNTVKFLKNFGSCVVNYKFCDTFMYSRTFHGTNYCQSQHLKTDAGYYVPHDGQVQKCVHGVTLLLASLSFCIIYLWNKRVAHKMCVAVFSIMCIGT